MKIKFNIILSKKLKKRCWFCIWKFRYAEFMLLKLISKFIERSHYNATNENENEKKKNVNVMKLKYV